MHDFVVRNLQTVPDNYPSQRAFWLATAKATAISVRTIEKIGRREIKDPKVSGIQVLADHFGYMPGRPKRKVQRAQVSA